MRSSYKLASAVSLVAMGLLVQGGVARGQVPLIKADNLNNLNDPLSWVANTAPDANSVLTWDTNVTTAQTVLLGADLSVRGIKIGDAVNGNPAGAVTFSAGNALTLGASGIDMSAATVDLNLATPLTLSAPQTWNVGAGVTARTTAGQIISAGGNAWTKAGAGTVSFNGYTASGTILSGAAVNLNGGNVLITGTGSSTFLNLTNNTLTFNGGTLTNNLGGNPTLEVAANIVVPAGQTGTISLGNRARLGSSATGNPGVTNSVTGGGTLNLIANTTSSRADVHAQMASFTGTVSFGGSGTWRIFFNPGKFNGNANSHVFVDGTITLSPQSNSGGNTWNMNALSGSSSTAILGGGTAGAVTYAVGASGLSTTFAGQIQGNANLTKNGTGALTMTGSTLSYTGVTTVNGGVLTLVNGKTGAGNTIINSGGTLAANGSLTGAGTVAAGGLLSPGLAGTNSGIGSTGFSLLSVVRGSTLAFDVTSTSVLDAININNSGGLTLAAGGSGNVSMRVLDTATGLTLNTDGVYTLFNLPAGGGGAAGGLATAMSILNPDPSKVYTFAAGANALTLSITSSAPTAVFWNSAGGGNWGVNGNWTANFPDGASKWASFGGGGTPLAAPSTVTVEASKTVGRMDFDSALAFTIAADAGQQINLDNGASAAAINVVSGGHTISAPMAMNANGVNFDVASSLAVSGALTGAGDVSKGGAGTLTLSNGGNSFANLFVNGGTVVLTEAGNTYNNATVNGGTLQIGDGVTDGTLPGGTLSSVAGTTVELRRAGDYSYPSARPGILGNLVFSGAGTATLNTDAFAPAATVIVNGATLKVTSVNVLAGGSAPNIGPVAGQPLQVQAGTFDMNGNDVYVGAISGVAGTITDNSAGTGTATLIYNSAADATFSGSIVDGPTRQVAVTKLSPNVANAIGVWTLSGSNNFSGGLNVRKGDVLALSETAVGEGPIVVTAAGTNASARSRLGIGGSFTIDNNITVVGLNTNSTGAVFVINPNDNVTLTGSLKQNAGAIGAGTTPGGTVQGPNGTGLLTLAGPLLASDDGLAYPFVFNSASQGNIRFSYPGGGLTDSFSGQYIVNQGNISLGADDGVAPGAELRLGSLGSGQTTFDLRGYNQTLRQLTRGGGSGSVTVTNSSATASTVTLFPDAAITFSGNIGGNLNVTNAGSNTVALTGNTTFTGNLSVTGTDGRVTLQNTHRPVTGNLNVTGERASVQLTATRGAGFTVVGEYNAINIGATGTVTVPATARDSVTATGVLVANTLSIASGGFLDLGNNDLIVKAGSESAVRALVAAWYNGGTPALVGVGSSATLPASTTFGVVSNSKFGFADRTSFDGVSVDASAVIVKYTWQGDTNLDGVLDAIDVNAVLNGWSNGLTGWANGDIDYSGVVDGADYGLLVAALGNYTGPLGDGIDPGTSGGAIPEPAALGLLVPALALGGRRRRS